VPSLDPAGFRRRPARHLDPDPDLDLDSTSTSTSTRPRPRPRPRFDPASTWTSTPTSSTPFGSPTAIPRYTCPFVQRGGPLRSFLAAADTQVAFVDGDDWLALVNRSPAGALPPAYAPTDLVDLGNGATRTPAACESAHDCLRRDAANALRVMLDQMRAEGIKGRVESAYRGFSTQCWVFASWASCARRESVSKCSAARFSSHAARSRLVRPIRLASTPGIGRLLPAPSCTTLKSGKAALNCATKLAQSSSGQQLVEVQTGTGWVVSKPSCTVM
jgi:hypothetical protein